MKYLLVVLTALLMTSPAFADQAALQDHIVTKVYFDTDKNDIRNTEVVKLEKAAENIKAGALTVILIGSADQRGKRLYNLALSQCRAEAVEKHLRDLGVEGNIILAFSYGEEKPKAPTDMVPEHLQENRRVDVLSLQPKVENILNPRRHRLSLHTGGGPFLLHKHIYYPSHVEVYQSYNFVGGLGYEYLTPWFDDRLSLGVLFFSNISGFINAGWDF